MAQTASSINLIEKKGDSFLTQFLNWTLTIGRLLIILTEMVALGTFLYRFDLDMKIVDLHDKIRGQALIVGNFKPAEDNFRNLQNRLALIKEYDSVSLTTNGIFKDIVALGKGKITFRNLTVESDNAKIEATAASATTLATFVNSLKAYPAVESIAIDKVENNATSAQINVSLSVSLKPAGFIKDDSQIKKPVPVQTDN